MDGANISKCTDDDLRDLGFDQIFKKKLMAKLKVSFGEHWRHMFTF